MVPGPLAVRLSLASTSVMMVITMIIMMVIMMIIMMVMEEDDQAECAQEPDCCDRLSDEDVLT